MSLFVHICRHFFFHQLFQKYSVSSYTLLGKVNGSCGYYTTATIIYLHCPFAVTTSDL